MTTRDTAPSLFDLFPDDPATTGEPAATKRVEPGEALAAAARNLVPLLESGHRLAAPVVTTAVHDAWRAVDPTDRSWNSKLCYDAAEAATVLFVRALGAAPCARRRRHARGVPRDDRTHRDAGADPLAPLRAPGRLRPVLDAAGARLRGLSWRHRCKRATPCWSRLPARGCSRPSPRRCSTTLPACTSTNSRRSGTRCSRTSTRRPPSRSTTPSTSATGSRTSC